VPSLTTLRVPRYAIGQRAGEMICNRLAGRAIKHPIVDIGFEMVARDSA
jgi:LacI family transcriptional regulator, gluconate utilization system Gnt-I transcriptional repressor